MEGRTRPLHPSTDSVRCLDHPVPGDLALAVHLRVHVHGPQGFVGLQHPDGVGEPVERHGSSWSGMAQRCSTVMVWVASTSVTISLTAPTSQAARRPRSEEHTSELQSRENLVCRLLLEKKKTS